jgi:hypothetical protein
MKGDVFDYSCLGHGTREQVRESWEIIACCMFQWASCNSFALGALVGLRSAIAPVLGRSRPWLVAQTGGVRMWTSPGVQEIRSRIQKLVIPRGRFLNSHWRQVTPKLMHPAATSYSKNNRGVNLVKCVSAVIRSV